MVFVNRNFGKEALIWSRVQGHIEGDSNRSQDEGHKVHGSDLLWCLRQAWYKKMRPKKLTAFDILKFFSGKVSEYALGNFIYDDSHYKQQVRIEKEGMVAHPDILSELENMVIELKQTDKKFGFVDPRDLLYNSFISYSTQVLYYLYLSGKKMGEIVVNHSSYKDILKLYTNVELDDVDKNPIRVWNLEIEGDYDYKIIEKDINFKKKLLEDAIEKDDVGYLPKLETIDINDMNKCKMCAYREECYQDVDYWDRLKYERIAVGKAGFTLDHIDTDNYREFKAKYGNEEIDKTNVNHLFRSMTDSGNFWFGNLGRHYKVELKKK